MLKRKRVLIIILIFLIVFPTAVLAVGNEEDVEGAQDHPLISRFPGSIIRYYETKKSDKYILPTGENVDEFNEEDERLDSKVLVGDITRIVYEAPEDTSPLEIYNNYESALKEAGFDIIFSGDIDKLGWFWTISLYNRDINPLPGEAHSLAISEQDFYYLSAELTEDDRREDIYISLTTTRADTGIGIVLDIIETAPPEENLIEVNLDNMAREIETKGSVAVYNIYFDSGKAELKSESDEALRKIADFLKENPDLELYVVGHTDSRGGLEFNLDLSARRAEAVKNALINEYDIDEERLKAEGVAFLAPKASNETEAGRSRNRRVELVKP
jgi:outer membrane protein OmpA-like peptidoglycan-associated protein